MERRARTYSEGAGGGGISTTFAMPTYQQALGVVSGSTGTPCANAGGDCREVPDVSADADPSSGYIIYDSVNGLKAGTPWAGRAARHRCGRAVLAVVASANGNTAGYGLLNPALYLLAQQSPGTYLNDVTSGNNDYNATAGGQYPAMTGYDMATGLGTPVASALAAGLTAIPLTVVVSGTQTYGGSPDVHGIGQLRGIGGDAVRRHAQHERAHLLHRGDRDDHQSVLGPWSYTLLASSCSGLTLRWPRRHRLCRRLHQRGERLHRHPGSRRHRRLGHPGVTGVRRRSPARPIRPPASR